MKSQNSSRRELINLVGILVDSPCIDNKQCAKCGASLAKINDDRRLLLVKEGDHFNLYQIYNLNEYYTDVPFYEQGMGMKIITRCIQPINDDHLVKNAFFKGCIDWNDVAYSEAIPDAFFKFE